MNQWKKKIHELNELKINEPMILKIGWLKVNEGRILKNLSQRLHCVN